MQDFRKLTVWQNAHRLALAVYRCTASFPKDERFGLTNQMRRSGNSIPMNVAEACGRGGKKEFAQFLRNSAGSASELEYQFILSRDLEFLQAPAAEKHITAVQEIRRMLASLLRTVSTDN
jgi:four helix bundle protein